MTQMMCCAALWLPGAPDRQQLQQGCAEAVVYVQDQQATSVPVPPAEVHGGQGTAPAAANSLCHNLEAGSATYCVRINAPQAVLQLLHDAHTLPNLCLHSPRLMSPVLLLTPVSHRVVIVSCLQAFAALLEAVLCDILH